MQTHGVTILSVRRLPSPYCRYNMLRQHDAVKNFLNAFYVSPWRSFKLCRLRRFSFSGLSRYAEYRAIAERLYDKKIVDIRKMQQLPTTRRVLFLHYNFTNCNCIVIFVIISEGFISHTRKTPVQHRLIVFRCTNIFINPLANTHLRTLHIRMHNIIFV